MKKIRKRTLSVFLMAALSGGALLHVSQNVQQAEDKLSRYERSYDSEREAIRVLNAEWAYLNSPARLEALSRDYLDMEAPESGQMMPDVSVLPRADIVSPVVGKYQNISQEPEALESESVVLVPAPGRKPKVTNGNFDDLLNKISKGGVR